MAIKIEKNVPMPSWANKTDFPLDKMEPGESFLIPNDMKNGIDTVRRLAKKLGVKIVSDTEEKGIRVWLVSKTK